MSRAPVRVLRLGLCPYTEALRVQERCVAAARAARPGPGPVPVPAPTPASTAGESVVLSEPAAPVYVWGLRGAPEAEAAARLRARGAGLLAARRGGHITFHGPGQLLAFPVLDLRRRRLPLRGYVAALEALVVRMCRRFGLAAARALPPPFTGVWMGDSKVCAIAPELFPCTTAPHLAPHPGSQHPQLGSVASSQGPAAQTPIFNTAPCPSPPETLTSGMRGWGEASHH
ncbi:octanoyl-[acyl-carrier-protein]:protein N-octanoyltransferase LIPT2, mitochondrial isoform X2 [Patagioenas fasciata]|uniref:octanoyl-[acyl-carrier-protein]:protein N-octanoyltransferase LIPT2, mitochondrial isoform X2 n=1 Tax=Patagioenas fasciata TaxID=372321 RepID=UPI003A995FC0